jgi:tetratricopeptide (TPR) repeat protein
MTNAPAVTPAVNPGTPQPEPAKPTPPPTVAPVPDAESHIKNLEDQLRAVEADKALLQAKLKEALSAQPASVDPQELTRAQDAVKELQKKNDLLQASLDQAKTNVPAVAPVIDENVKASLAEANRKVSQLNDENAKLALANDALQGQLKKVVAPDANAVALREENAILKKQLADLQSKSEPSSSTDELSRQLKESQAQIATLQSDKEVLRLQKLALENQLQKIAATPAPVVSAAMLDSLTADKIAKLEAQRDALQKTVDAVTKDLYGKKKGKAMSAHIDEMVRAMAVMQAQMGVLQATTVPYSAEELALLSQPATTLLMASARSNVKKAVRELPASASVTLDQARRYFVAHDLAKAEEKYLEVLKLDEKNVAVLADLAAIELELGHADEAEKHIKAALVVEPNDDYSLFVLGQVKFREKNYDEAFAALSQAAQINPQNAKVQNFLGLTLSEKGMRGPAETAFRKAIQFDPEFAQAHLNLAVVYITQTPPLVELAKWHYQKALAAGQPPKPDLEKLLDPTKINDSAH